jgi:glucokinase
MGIVTLFEFLTEDQGKKAAPHVESAVKEKDFAALISQSAMDKSCPVCVEVMTLFTRYMATEAAQLALKTKSVGGLIIAGGIPPKILPLLQQDNRWREYFITRNGRMDALIRQVKVQVVLNEKLPLLGAAYYAAFNM